MRSFIPLKKTIDFRINFVPSQKIIVCLTKSGEEEQRVFWNAPIDVMNEGKQLAAMKIVC